MTRWVRSRVRFLHHGGRRVLVGITLLTGHLSAQASPTNRETVVAAWQLLNEGYGNFGCKRINWLAFRDEYLSRGSRAPNEAALLDVLGEMIALLNDNHVTLQAGERRVRSGNLDAVPRGTWQLEVIIARYLRGTMHPLLSGTAGAGWLPDSVGYLHFREFGDTRATAAALDSVLVSFQDARALVIDLRDNIGGNDRAAQQLLHRLADSTRVYLTSRTRNGEPGVQYFPPRVFQMTPVMGIRFLGPIVALTNRQTVSAAENLLLGIRELPHASIVGEPTAGAFADVRRDRLPNGWILTYPFNEFRDRRGTCWEGVGLAPDVFAITTAADLAARRDPILEAALQQLHRPPK